MLCRRLLKLVLLTVIVASCHDAAGMPRQWGPLTLGRGDRCPNVAGRYFDSSAPVSWVLALGHIPRDSVKTDWAYFELAGVADTALAVTVATRDGVKHTARLARGTQYAGDYSCVDGWLQFGDGAVPNLWDADITTARFRPRRHAMRIAPGANKALVARLDYISFDEFTVWCGDGCKGFPLPWTFETHSKWSSARAWNADSAFLYADGIEQPHDVLSATVNDRLSREAQALENGPDASGQADMQERARSATSAEYHKLRVYWRFPERTR